MAKESKFSKKINDIFSKINNKINLSSSFFSHKGYEEVNEIRNDIGLIENSIANQKIKISVKKSTEDFFNRIFKYLNALRYTESIFFLSILFILPTLYLGIKYDTFSMWWFSIDLTILIFTKIFKLSIIEALKQFLKALQSNLKNL